MRFEYTRQGCKEAEFFLSAIGNDRNDLDGWNYVNYANGVYEENKEIVDMVGDIVGAVSDHESSQHGVDYDELINELYKIIKKWQK